jgi:hypothetical protein
MDHFALEHTEVTFKAKPRDRSVHSPPYPRALTSRQSRRSHAFPALILLFPSFAAHRDAPTRDTTSHCPGYLQLAAARLCFAPAPAPSPFRPSPTPGVPARRRIGDARARPSGNSGGGGGPSGGGAGRASAQRVRGGDAGAAAATAAAAAPPVAPPHQRAPILGRGVVVASPEVDDVPAGVRCASWRLAAEANNLTPWKAVQAECLAHVRDYVTASPTAPTSSLSRGSSPPTRAPRRSGRRPRRLGVRRRQDAALQPPQLRRPRIRVRPLASRVPLTKKGYIASCGASSSCRVTVSRQPQMHEKWQQGNKKNFQGPRVVQTLCTYVTSR